MTTTTKPPSTVLMVDSLSFKDFKRFFNALSIKNLPFIRAGDLINFFIPAYQLKVKK